MSGFLATLGSIASTIISKAAPIAISVGKGAFAGLIQGLTSLDGKAAFIPRSRYDLTGYKAHLAGYRAHLGDENGITDEGETQITEGMANSEQILTGLQGEKLSTAIENYGTYKVLEGNILLGSLINNKANQIMLQASPQYMYSATTESSSLSENLDIPIIHMKDHAYVHLIPKLFEGYDELIKHDFFQLSEIIIKPSQLSFSTVPVKIIYIPVSMDTTHITNEELERCSNSCIIQSGSVTNYHIRCPCPTTFKSDGDFVPDPINLNPNYAIGVKSLIKNYSNDEVNNNSGKFLSYGTVCFLSENATQDVIAFKFSITLIFNVYDIFNMPLTSNSGSSGSSTTQSSPTKTVENSNCLSKRKVKFNVKA